MALSKRTAISVTFSGWSISAPPIIAQMALRLDSAIQSPIEKRIAASMRTCSSGTAYSRMSGHTRVLLILFLREHYRADHCGDEQHRRDLEWHDVRLEEGATERLGGHGEFTASG